MRIDPGAAVPVLCANEHGAQPFIRQSRLPPRSSSERGLALKAALRWNPALLETRLAYPMTTLGTGAAMAISWRPTTIGGIILSLVLLMAVSWWLTGKIIRERDLTSLIFRLF